MEKVLLLRVVQCRFWTLITVLICLPTCPVTFANAAPRTFTFARAAWLSEVPLVMKIVFGEISLDAPLLWKVSRCGITFQVPVTTPPEKLHVVFGSEVKHPLEKTSGESVLVSTLSESVRACT